VLTAHFSLTRSATYGPPEVGFTEVWRSTATGRSRTAAEVESTIQPSRHPRQARAVALVHAAHRREGMRRDRLFTIRNGIFVRGEGGFGGEAGPNRAGRRNSRSPPPEAVVSMTTRVDQTAALPLERRPQPAPTPIPQWRWPPGFERPIMHGLCAHSDSSAAHLWGYACDGDADRGRPGLGVRFSSPVHAGRHDRHPYFWSDGRRHEVRGHSWATTVLSEGYLTLR